MFPNKSYETYVSMLISVDFRRFLVFTRAEVTFLSISQRLHLEVDDSTRNAPRFQRSNIQVVIAFLSSD